jgi:3-polyprenyl-4-hydroxybenzoate decarboxylase
MTRGSHTTIRDLDEAALSGLLSMCSNPVAADEIAPWVDPATLAILEETGVLLSGTQSELEAVLRSRLPAARAPLPCRHLVLGMTGSIGVALMTPMLYELRGAVERLDVILSNSARRFLEPRGLAYLGINVWCEPDAIELAPRVLHIELSKADVILVLPASARALHRLAHATCEDLLSQTVCASRGQLIVVPNMNGAMWDHPAVQRNVAQLRADGAWVVEPGPAIEVSRGELTHGGCGVLPGQIIDFLRRFADLHRDQVAVEVAA